MIRWVLLPLVTVGLTFAACDSGDEAAPESAAEEALPTREIAGDADLADVRVIDGWSETLRRGDVEAAAEFFALPSVAENAGVLLEIESREQAVLFNTSLPCGARLTRAEAEGEFVTATFRLTERPGPGTCGSGAGSEATTAFVIEDGEIVEWRRVAVGGEQAPSRAV